MNFVDVEITNLVLHVQNQRDGAPLAQRDALARIINQEPTEFVDLVGQIADTGRYDSIVTQGSPSLPASRKNEGSSTVNNRQIAALKTFLNPSILDGLSIRPYVRKKLARLAMGSPCNSTDASSGCSPHGNVRSCPPRHWPKPVHFTPLRYPGGKGKLAPFVKRVIEANDLLDGEYVEPFAGGAAIALELLIQEYVSRVHINDISRPVYAFWYSVLNHTDDVLRMLRDIPLSISSWDHQKDIYKHADDHDDLELGFATFFLNRTNRSGIFNAGVIGGRRQVGTWKMGARLNISELANRIETIAAFRRRISLTRIDAVVFIGSILPTLSPKSLIYFDPPYYMKGKDLYYDYYNHADHVAVRNLIKASMKRRKWMVSYDNVKPIRDLYSECRGIAYGLGYSAREARAGSEVIYFSDNMYVPEMAGGMRRLIGGARPQRAIGFQPRMYEQTHSMTRIVEEE